MAKVISGTGALRVDLEVNTPRTMGDSDHRGWYKHEKIPHFDGAGLYQSITYRLDDSLPRSALARLEEGLRENAMDASKLEAERRIRVEALLDQGHGSCALRLGHHANLVLEGWRHFDGQRYDLIIGVVMPNHVHVLVRIFPGTRLGDLVKSWKSFTSRRFETDTKTGTTPGWQRGYWDRFIRNEAHYWTAVQYIAHNPVKAGLAQTWEDWAHLVIGRVDAFG